MYACCGVPNGSAVQQGATGGRRKAGGGTERPVTGVQSQFNTQSTHC